jgi:hypothetical protein
MNNLVIVWKVHLCTAHKKNIAVNLYSSLRHTVTSSFIVILSTVDLMLLYMVKSHWRMKYKEMHASRI